MPPLFGDKGKRSAKVTETISLATLKGDELVKLAEKAIEEIGRRGDAGDAKMREAARRFGHVGEKDSREQGIYQHAKDMAAAYLAFRSDKSSPEKAKALSDAADLYQGEIKQVPDKEIDEALKAADRGIAAAFTGEDGKSLFEVAGGDFEGMSPDEIRHMSSGWGGGFPRPRKGAK